MKAIETITVYCASSDKCDESYLAAASRLGTLLAKKGKTIIYGGGKIGLMGNLAESSMKNGGTVIGVIPKFMVDVEWANNDISKLIISSDMRERKKIMMEKANAIIALPGGCGTFEELLEAITCKRLGLINYPIIIANLNGYYNPLIELLNNSINEGFMRAVHRDIWQVANSIDEIFEELESPKHWSKDAIKFASV